MRWIEKWMTPFWWSRRALSPCKVWERSYNACRLQARKYGVCHHVFSVCHSEAGALFVRRWHTLNRWWFMGQFWYCLTVFFSIYCPFKCIRQFLLLLLGGATSLKFRKIAFKNFDNSKNRRKSLCARLRVDSWEIWRKFHRSSLGPRM